MMKVKYLNNFDKRISFFSSILNRNNNSILNYKSKIPLVLKQESLDTKNSNLKIDNKTFKYITNNNSLFNKYINENLLNLYSFKFISHAKNQISVESTLNHKYLKNSINENKTYLDKYLNNKRIFSIVKNISNKKNINYEEYIFKSNTLKKELNLENKKQNFIFRKEDKEENKIREKEIENRVIKHFEENISEKTILKSINKVNISTIENKHIINQRDEKVLTNRIFESVIKKWDKETKRKGYLYE